MRIRYTGPKPEKRVSFSNKNHGQPYVFTPECDIEDLEVIKWLLHPDRMGLFVESPVKEDPAVAADIKKVAKKS